MYRQSVTTDYAQWAIRGNSSSIWQTDAHGVIVAYAVSQQCSRAPFIVLRVLWICVSLHKLWGCLWSVGVLWLCKGNTPKPRGCGAGNFKHQVEGGGVLPKVKKKS